MSIYIDNYKKIKQELSSYNAHLVAVSKTKPAEDIMALYKAGQRAFGENYVQELVRKQEDLPKDIQWHFIGHLQRNKVKYIAPFVNMIHGVDKLKLLKEINKQATKTRRVIDCLLQVHIAHEETKFGLDEQELFTLLKSVIEQPDAFTHVRLCGLMGMATNTPDRQQVRKEFHTLKELLEKVNAEFKKELKDFSALSMGMSSDYKLALEEGSTLIRVGSLLFGAREYPNAG